MVEFYLPNANPFPGLQYISTSGSPTLLNNLHAFWDFESNGSDSHTNGYHLTELNTPDYVSGLVGNAGQCLATNLEGYDRPYELGFHVDSSPFSVWIWYKTDISTSGRILIWSVQQTTRRWYQVVQEQNVYSVFAFLVNEFVDKSLSVGVTESLVYNSLYIDWDGVSTLRTSLNNGALREVVGPMQTGFQPTLAMRSGLGGVNGDITYDSVGYWLRRLNLNERTFLQNLGDGRGYADLEKYKE